MRTTTDKPLKNIRHIQIEVPADLYKDFRANCLEEDTNMRAKLLQLMTNYTQVRGNRKLTLDELLSLSKEDQEAAFGKATRAAIAKAHALGLPTTHGDDNGVYQLYPDGHKEYIKLYNKEELDD